ncbi:6137_t:CDS:2 [Cetraspora pellucida]|uniref:6137_t:CDS:1 n=1 Tax=Cetraspora pellucida TaxID=1433469 RepID=A0A9N9GAX6_9GLOM|nr:6137_t:CDS:2 [Cetraspora pellucida]
MKKHKRIYMPEQKAARNEAKRKRLASMPPEEQLSYQIPAELPQLSQVEEMLIAQILPILTVYKLQGGQLGYQGNDFTSFQDFKIKRSNILTWLMYLKSNNPFYFNIEIDQDILQTIPEDGSIFNRLNTIYDNNLSKDMTFLNNNDILSTSEDYIKHSFIPISVSKETEKVVTYSEINQLVNLNPNILINWPTIKDNPISEFEEVGYITKAFPTLFPKGKADLCSTQRYHQVYPAEYFEHLIKYHDGRFAQHKRFQDANLIVEDIQELLHTNNSLANQIVQYGNTLRGTQPY